MNLEQINREGAQRYFSEKGMYQNPYQQNSDEFNAFERSWMQSHKKSDGKFENTEKYLATPKRVNASMSVDAQAAKYRLRKE